jgi:hypothetical protein
VVRSRPPGRAVGSDAAPAVESQPPACGCVADQAPDEIGVGVDQSRQLVERDRSVEAIGDLEAAQRREGGVVEDAEEALEHLQRWWRQAAMERCDRGAQPLDRGRRAGRRQGRSPHTTSRTRVGPAMLPACQIV